MAEKCSKDGCDNIDRPTGADTDKCNTHHQEYLAGKAKRDARAGKVGGYKNEADKKAKRTRTKKQTEAPAEDAPKED